MYPNIYLAISKPIRPIGFSTAVNMRDVFNVFPFYILASSIIAIGIAGEITFFKQNQDKTLIVQLKIYIIIFSI